MPSSDSPAVVKISQRPAKSCTECIRRKTRCDKRYPCEPCRRRGVEDKCRAALQYRPVDEASELGRLPSGRPPGLGAGAGGSGGDVLGGILAELASLRRRVTVLEGERRRGDETSSPPPPGETPGAVHNQDQEEKDEPGDAATTLEFLALGIDRRLQHAPAQASRARHASSSSDARSQGPASLHPTAHILEAGTGPGPVNELITSTLLPRSTTSAILHFAQTKGAWQHCCVWFPAFERQMDEFWDTIEEGRDGGSGGGEDDADGWERVDGTWVALLYVIMGTGVHQMSEEDAAACGLSDADRFILPSAFTEAAIASLTDASFLSRPTMWTVQAIAILTLCGHNVCESDLLSSLLAVGIKLAQTLGLHSLGNRHSAPRSAAQGQGQGRDASERTWEELGRRVWWGLVQEDWFSIPFRGVWSVHVDHFDTPMPTNRDDEAVESGDKETGGALTIAFKTRFSSQVAMVVQDSFTQLRLRGDQDAFSVAETASARIRQHLSSLPPGLGETTPVSTPATAPPWASVMRHYLVISATHKILIVYRASLSRDLSTSERLRASAACTDAAFAIVDELDRGGRQNGVCQSLWTIPYHGLAAGVVLGIDLIKLVATARPAGGVGAGADAGAYAGPNVEVEIQRRRIGVRRAREGLERLAPTSRIARRGLQVLDDLVAEVDVFAKGNAQGSVAGILKRIAVPANELLETPTTSPVPHNTQLPDGRPVNDIDMTGWTGMTPYVVDYDGGGAFPSLMDPSTLNMDDFLQNLQLSVPDIGRLFDGSLGTF